MYTQHHRETKVIIQYDADAVCSAAAAAALQDQGNLTQ